jgi:glycosyltransferase involved in cell wall biosynthesis
VAAVIHHGVDVERFPVGDGSGGYALFLGRMSPDKAAHVAARVAREAGMPLRIAAKMREPAERAYFDAEVAPLLGGDVEYVGEVGGREKLELLADAACLLNPVAWPEPFGMVMIEALACGTPVVATPCGSVPEIVCDGITGFVRSSEAELIEALGQVGELDRAWCRRDAEARFSTQRMVADHVALYRQAVATHQSIAAAG